MIYVILGTRAQLIKMAPLIKQMQSKNYAFTLVHTGQHKESLAEILQDFNLDVAWHYLYSSKEEVKSIVHAVRWLIRLFSQIILKPAQLLPDYQDYAAGQNIVLVHGDTFSTVIGALLAKRLGIKVGHIESGLRSFNLFEPFPEEINRLITFKLTDIAFCPGQWALDNLRRYSCIKVNTENNTLWDALNYALTLPGDDSCPIPDQAFGIISIHRFENLFNRNRLTKIIQQITEISRSYYLVFVLHPSTEKRLQTMQLLDALQTNPNISVRKRTGYVNFVRLLAAGTFVITDGGSNQEELSYLNVPTFLMRRSTERQEGLNNNVVLGKLSDRSLLEFVAHLNKSGTSRLAAPASVASPCEIICRHVEFAAR